MKIKHKSRLWTAALLGALMVSAVVISLATATGQIKDDVCHVTNDPKPGDGHVITIAEPAWEMHFAHGDKMIGDGAVPNGDGTCSLVTFEAVDDERSTPVNTPITIDVLGNDTYVGDVDVFVQDFPSKGSVDPPAEDDTIKYYPPGDPGTDSFTYYFCSTDGSGVCSNIATVTITVNP